VQDADTFNIVRSEILGKREQKTHYPLYFLARNFSDFCIMETIGMIFITLKIIDGLRIVGKMNTIMLTFITSGKYFSIFMCLHFFFHIALIPLAQSTYGTSLVGYKLIPDCLNSLLMISYSKGNLNQLFDFNEFWGLLLLILYYIFALYFLHAVFHMVQFDALRNTVLLYGLK